MANIKTGVSIYSYTQEYSKSEYSLEEIIKKSSEHGAQGLEIVGSQMIKSYPSISDEEAEYILSLCRKYNVELVSYGANTDVGLRSDRNLSHDELFHSTMLDLETAHKLGCKVMRVQFMLSPEVLKELAPYAQLYNIKMGIEIHNPETPSTPKIREYLEVIKEVKSPYLGLIPDFGCFATKPNKPHWESALENGARLEVLNEMAQLRYEEVNRQDALKQLEKHGVNQAEMIAFNGMYGFVTFYKEPDLEGLKEIMPYCIHFHGKLHYIDENLEEASIPYSDVLKVIKNSDYDGYIVAEYEDQSGPSDLMVSRFIKLMNKNLEV